MMGEPRTIVVSCFFEKYIYGIGCSLRHFSFAFVSNRDRLFVHQTKPTVEDPAIYCCLKIRIQDSDSQADR